MGRMQREKGKRFERKIAAVFREAWPGTVVRRSSQAERAFNSDIFVENGPALLRCLWLELQDTRTPDPIGKLEQAERDVDAAKTATLEAALRSPGESFPYPMRHAVVIWHRISERTVWVTMRAKVFDALRLVGNGTLDDTPITMTLDGLIAVLKRAT